MDPQQLKEFDEDEAPGPAVADPLSFIRPRQQRVVNAGYSRWVKWLRKILPVGAFLVLLALVVWPMFETARIKAIAIGAIPDLVIKNLRLTGLDSKNEPYSLLAAKTTRPGGLKNVYDLDKPEAEITLQNGTWVSGKAASGRFDQDTRRLWLGGDVQLYQDKGNQFTTEEAQVDLNNNNAWGSKPVHIQGGFGEIDGQGFRIMDSGNVMVVTGPASATLDLHTTSTSDRPTTAAH